MLYYTDFHVEIDNILTTTSQYRTIKNDRGQLVSIVKLQTPGSLSSACRIAHQADLEYPEQIRRDGFSLRAIDQAGKVDEASISRTR